MMEMNHERMKFMESSLENEGAHPFLKGARAPIILGGASTHLFEGSSTHYFKRARAPIIQEGSPALKMMWQFGT